MNVQFRKAAGQDLCDACWEGIKLNRNTYRFEQMEKGGQIEFDWNARDVEETDDDPPWEDIDPEEMERNTPALSEV